jgi:hypothetical protein
MPRKVTKSSNNIEKNCTKCGKTKKIAKDFYKNRDHVEGHFCDNWCRSCCLSYITNQESLKVYCKENLRLFSEELWEQVQPLAIQRLEKDEGYINASIKEKQEILANRTITSYLQQQSQSQYYHYNGNMKSQIESDIQGNEISNNFTEKVYSKKWRGHYTQQNLDYLEDYYACLQRDFKIDNKNHEDYAMKASKSSLMADKAYEDWMNGKGTEKAYRDAQTAFDTVCQSAKFSEKTRSYTDSNGMGSLGEITKRLEIDGFLQKKIKFEKDDVDSIIEDFRWILASIGVDASGEQI